MGLQTIVTVIHITSPEVHGVKKTLDTRVLLEKQKPQIQAEQVVKIRAKL